MDGKKTDIENELDTLKKKFTEAEYENAKLRNAQNNLMHKLGRTRERLFQHLFATRMILGSAFMWSFIAFIIILGCIMFMRASEAYEMAPFYVNDKLAQVPMWGLVIVGWVFIILFFIWLWFYYFIINDDWVLGEVE